MSRDIGSTSDLPLASAAPARATRDFGVPGRLALVAVAHVGFVAAIASSVTSSAPRAPSPAPVMVSFVAAAPVQAPPVVVPEPPLPKPKPKPTPKPKPKPQPDPKPAEKPVERPEPQPEAPVTPAAPVAQAKKVAPEPLAPPEPPAPPVPPTPPTVTSGLQYLETPEPVYPHASRRLGEEGQVLLRVLVNVRGRIERADVHTSSGSPRLDEAARRAVLRWVLKPHIENGRAVPAYGFIPVGFKLNS